MTKILRRSPLLRPTFVIASSFLGAVVILGTAYEGCVAAGVCYSANEIRARASELDKLPYLPPETVVGERTVVIKTTAQEDACGFNTSGKVPYTLKSDGKEYSVSCDGHNPWEKNTPAVK